MAAFASWVVLGDILSAPCCGLSVNAGWQPAASAAPTASEVRLNARLATCPRPFGEGGRVDRLTFAYALDYLQRRQLRVLYLAFGDTVEQAMPATTPGIGKPRTRPMPTWKPAAPPRRPLVQKSVGQ